MFPQLLGGLWLTTNDQESHISAAYTVTRTETRCRISTHHHTFTHTHGRTRTYIFTQHNQCRISKDARSFEKYQETKTSGVTQLSSSSVFSPFCLRLWLLIIPLRISKGVELTGSLGTLKGSVSCHANLIFSFNPKFYSSLVYVLVQLSPLCLTDVILIETDQNSAAVSATK